MSAWTFRGRNATKSYDGGESFADRDISIDVDQARSTVCSDPTGPASRRSSYR
jgi:hypothetical protein